MRRDKNYQRAASQIDERLDEARELIDSAHNYMQLDRPHDAVDLLDAAKQKIEGAIVSARWATTLPNPED